MTTTTGCTTTNPGTTATGDGSYAYSPWAGTTSSGATNTEGGTTYEFHPPGQMDGATATMTIDDNGAISYTFDPDGDGPQEAVTVSQDEYLETLSDAAGGDAEAIAKLESWGIETSTEAGSGTSVDFAPHGLKDGATATMTFNEDGSITYTFDPDGEGGQDAITVTEEEYQQTLSDAAEGDAEATATLESWGFDADVAAAATGGDGGLTVSFTPPGLKDEATATMTFNEDGSITYTFDPDGEGGQDAITVTKEEYDEALTNAANGDQDAIDAPRELGYRS